MNTSTTTIHIQNKQLKNWLLSQAKSSNKSLSEIIVEILTEYYQSQSSKISEL
jgi:hypothetical protein